MTTTEERATQPSRRPEASPVLKWTKRASHPMKQSHESPTVTVLVPCYNYAHYLRQCVESILAQDGVALDVLIIDDASTDNSAEVAQELAREDPRVRVIIHDQNKGHIATYNEGIDQIRGKYFALISADDFLPPGALRRATSIMESREDVVLVYGDIKRCRHSAPCTHRSHSGSWHASVMPGYEWIQYICRVHNVIASPEVVVRSCVQQREGKYNAALPYSADAEMWLRIAKHGSVAYLRGAVQAFYRVHRSSMSHTRFAQRILGLRQGHQVFESFFSAWSEQPPQASAWRHQALLRLAGVALSHACDVITFRYPEDPQSYLDFADGLGVDYSGLPDYKRYLMLTTNDSVSGALLSAYVRARCRARRAYHLLRAKWEDWR